MIELIARSQETMVPFSAFCDKTAPLCYLGATSGTWEEALIEFAARVCYASEAKMGKVPKFIWQRMRDGHMDVIEHPHIGIMIGNPHWTRIDFAEFARVGLFQVPVLRHAEVSTVATTSGVRLLIYANLRVWYELLRTPAFLATLPAGDEVRLATELRSIAPAVFGGASLALDTPRNRYGTTWTNGVNRIALLSVTPPYLDHFSSVSPPRESPWHGGAATWYLSGVSRAMTHQLVRHRLLSFSMQSQRYVDAERGGWPMIEPPSIAANPEAHALYQITMSELMATYRKLRGMSIKKEDARAVLPNATGTSLVVSGPFSAWRVFFEQRLAQDAQGEIREIAQAMACDMRSVFPQYWEHVEAVHNAKLPIDNSGNT